MSLFRLNSKFSQHLKIKIVKYFMDMVILSRLRCVPSSGYDIIVHIHQKSNLHISSGSIYSTLYSMERTGLVKGRPTVNKRIYYITQEGVNYIENVLDNLDEVCNFIKEILN